MQPSGGWRARMAAFNAATASLVSIARLIANPTTRRDQASRIAAISAHLSLCSCRRKVQIGPYCFL
jgi:hypothetical protein